MVLFPVVDIFSRIPAGLTTDQLMTAPLAGQVSVTLFVVSSEQIVWLGIEALSSTDGFTVMVNVSLSPVQLLVDGVTIISEEMGLFVVLLAVNEGIVFVPLVALSPIALFELVQLKVVLATVPAKVISPVMSSLQNSRSVVGVTTGFGFTVMVYVNESIQVVVPV